MRPGRHAGRRPARGRRAESRETRRRRCSSTATTTSRTPATSRDWTTPPFEPDIRDGRLYARGACDDKGNFLPLLHVACAMADAGELPLNVRVLIEGAEETGGDDVNEWVEADERGADCAIVFDSAMLDAETPGPHRRHARHGLRPPDRAHRRAERALGHVRRRRAQRLARAAHDARGRCPARPPGRAARGRRAAERRGARRAGLRCRTAPRCSPRPAPCPPTQDAVAEFYERTTADASLDVHRIEGGQTRTIVPPEARCDLSVRLAPGQDPAAIAAALEALLRGALPAGAELELRTGTGLALALRSRRRPAADRPRGDGTRPAAASPR